MKNESIVYWAVVSKIELDSRQNLLLDPPKSLKKELMHRVNPNRPAAAYESCKSFHQVFTNMFMLTHPYTLEWNKSIPKGTIFNHRDDSGFLDSELVDYDLQWVFFSEDSIEMEITPAYLHQKKSDSYGYLVAGSYDISKWCRAINLSWQLWDKVEELAFNEGDAAAYLNFRTKNKVVLKQFQPTDKMYEVMLGCQGFKKIKPNQSLESLYHRFTRTHRDKIVLKEIKNNLLD